MNKAIVNESKTLVNSFDTFKSKVDRYAKAVNAKAKTFNNGDRYFGIVYGDPTVRIYGRPDSLTVLAKVGYNPKNATAFEIK